MKTAILLIGAPATGKSTLARTLALCFGLPVISIGDLIRERRRTDPAFRRMTDRAFHGHEAFGGGAYDDLVAPEVERLAALSPVIVDGGPGIEGVIDRVRDVSWPVVELTAPAGHRESRRSERSKAEGRPDDRADWFERRAAVYRRWRSAFHVGPDALRIDTATHDSGKAALVAASWISVRLVGRNGGSRFDRNGPARPGKWNDPVLLVKPGFHYRTNDLMAAIERVLLQYDLHVTDTKVWEGGTPQTRNSWIAHLGDHFFWSSAGSRLDPSGKVGGLERARRHSVAEVAARWQNASLRTKVGLGRWEALLETGEWMVNGHVPKLYEEFTSTGSITLALRLTRGGERHCSWRRLRRSLLGATDPAEADAASLRGLARAGRIPLHGRAVTFGNNAFHLSAGPLEAVRERRIWGLESAESAAEPEWNGFQPDAGMRSWFEMSYESDAGRAELLRLCDVTAYGR
ncbi:AAA family ATPase [Actinomadura chibensis]|uniref:Adenylate kinase n=1 Tax=Actinomadura chibensis TaxID=392828 RepID=A0A5D0NWA1_9ACTN|nr:AAA family ATPase [Actinomadura chibensis]TYB48542.1 AAA family ATPase [Actinomadura chibensis]